MVSMKVVIGYIYIIREKIRAIDKDNLWDYYSPNLKCDEITLTGWEKKNRIRLPDSYKEFLLAANGWKCIMQDFDLYGIDDLSLDNSNPKIEFRDYCKDYLNNVGNKNLLLPIGGSDYSNDMFLLVLDINSDFYGNVIWVAGEEVERHKTFQDFMLSMAEYNKLCYERMTGKKYTD